MIPAAEVRRRERGLTLLEVLAATMIFALVMTVLIGTSSTAIHREGLSARRLEANLVADAVVADLEIQMRKQIAPVVERTEWTIKTEDEEYGIRVQNRTLQEALAAPAETVADQLAADAGNPVPALPAPGSTRIAGGSGIGTLLAGELPEVAKHLREYDIEVAWIGADGPESVTRTTFAFDWQAAKLEFAPLFAGGAGAGKDAGEDGEKPDPGKPNPVDPRQGGQPAP